MKHLALQSQEAFRGKPYSKRSPYPVLIAEISPVEKIDFAPERLGVVHVPDFQDEIEILLEELWVF